MRHKALVRDGKGRVESRLVPTPHPGPDGLLIRMHVAGICGTDLQILRGVRDDPVPILGHEGLGVVAARGERVEGFHTGDVVTFNPTSPRAPERILGHTLPGVFQEYVLFSRAELEEGMVVRMEGGLRAELGALIEPLASVLYGQELVRLAVLPRSVALFGAGTIGLLQYLTLKLAGVRQLFLIHPRESRLRHVHERGLVDAASLVPAGEGQVEHILEKTGRHGVDAAILCTPRTASLEALRGALRLVRAGGCIDLFGGFPSGASLAELPGVDLEGIRRGNGCGSPCPGRLVHLRTREGCPLVLTGHRGAASRHLQAAIAMLSRHSGLLGGLITHRASLDAAAAMLRLHAETGVRRYEEQEWLKAVIDFRLDGHVVRVAPRHPLEAGEAGGRNT